MADVIRAELNINLSEYKRLAPAMNDVEMIKWGEKIIKACPYIRWDLHDHRWICMSEAADNLHPKNANINLSMVPEIIDVRLTFLISKNGAKNYVMPSDVLIVPAVKLSWIVGCLNSL
mgnify:FL=1